jgi:hypothetical protein
VGSPNSSACGATSVRGGSGAAVNAEEEEEEEEDGDEDEKRVREGLRRLGGKDSEDDDSRGQGNNGAGGGAYRHQSDQGSARPERLTGNSGMDIAMDRAGVAQQVEQSGRAGGEDENPSAMDVDEDTADVANQGEQSGAVDVDMREGSMNEHDKVPNDATPESSPRKTPSPFDDSLSNEKDSPMAGEKRKNPTREAKTKKTDELLLPPPKTKLKPRSRSRPRPKPKPKPKPKPESKIQSRAQSVDAVERNYFEEIEFGGVSRLADIIDLTQDMVSHLPS